MLPAVALLLPYVHSVVLVDPPSWRGFPLPMSLCNLRDLDLQVSVLHRQCAHKAPQSFLRTPAPVKTYVVLHSEAGRAC